jgi:hypothetical protein
LTSRASLRGNIPHWVYGEDCLRFAGLVVVTRDSAVLTTPPGEIRLDARWASQRRLMVHGRPTVSKCETFDWSGSEWLAVSISEQLAAECIERFSDSPPVAYGWFRRALRSLGQLGPSGDRPAYTGGSFDYNRTEEAIKRGSPEWSEERVAMISDLLGMLRPFVADRDALLLRGSLLAGMTMGVTSDLFPTLTEDEMAEVSRRVP